MTHLSIGVIIYLKGLSVRHPKGARSIGIGHPRSGDRCTKTLLSPRPLVGRRADTPLSATRKGSWHNAYDYTSVVGTSCLDRCLWSGHPSDAAYLLFDGFHLRSVDIGSVGKTVTGVAPRQGCPLFSPDVEGRSPEDSGLRWGSIPATPLGCRTDCLTGKCDTLSGSYFFLELLSRSLRHFVPRHAGYRTMIPPGLRPCGIDRR